MAIASRRSRALEIPKKTTDSTQMRDIFIDLMTNLEVEYGRKNLIYPETIVFVVGPSKAGKTTLSLVLTEMLGYQNAPIPLRSLCRSVITSNGGKFQIDLIVERLVKEIFLIKDKKGVVIDDFVSTSCARLLPFLYEYLDLLAAANNKPRPEFKFCILYANQSVAIERRALAGELNKMNNRKFIQLFRKFYKRTQQVVEILNMYFRFNIINCNGTLEETKEIALGEMQSELNGSKNQYACLSDLLSSNPTVAINRQYQESQWESKNNPSSSIPAHVASQRRMSHQHLAYLEKVKAIQTLEREEYIRQQSISQMPRSPIMRRPFTPKQRLSSVRLSVDAQEFEPAIEERRSSGRGSNQRGQTTNRQSKKRSVTASLQQERRRHSPRQEQLRNSRRVSTQQERRRHNPRVSPQQERRRQSPRQEQLRHSPRLSPKDTNITGISDFEVDNFIELFLEHNVNGFIEDCRAVNRNSVSAEMATIDKIIRTNAARGSSPKFGGHIKKITMADKDNITKDSMSVSPIVIGQKCLLQWNKSGKCFIVDYDMNYYSYMPFNLPEVKNSVVDGVLAFAKDRIIFVVNDCAYLNGKNVVVRSFEDRQACARDIVDIILQYVENGMQITQNLFKPIKEKFKFSDLVKKGKCRMKGSPRCSGFLLVPTNSKFWFSARKKGYKWALSDTVISFKDMKNLIKDIQVRTD